MAAGLARPHAHSAAHAATLKAEVHIESPHIGKPNACSRAAHWELGPGRLGAAPLAPLASVLSSKPWETVRGLSLGCAVNVCASQSSYQRPQEACL